MDVFASKLCADATQSFTEGCQFGCKLEEPNGPITPSSCSNIEGTLDDLRATFDFSFKNADSGVNEQQLTQNLLVASSRDIITGDRTTRQSSRFDALDIFDNPPLGTGPLWDTRFSIDFDSNRSTGDFTVERSTATGRTTAVKAKEGAKLVFSVEMTGLLWNYFGYYFTPEQKQLIKELQNAIPGNYNDPGYVEARQKYLEAVDPQTYDVPIPAKPIRGTAYVSTSTLNVEGKDNTNWASYGKDFDAIGKLIGVKVGENIPSGDSNNDATFIGRDYFTIRIKGDSLREDKEVFTVQMKQSLSAAPAVNNYIQEIGVYIIDDTKLPPIPLDFKFSKSQRELLGVLARDGNFDDYISNLQSVVGDMIDDKSSSIVVEMQTRILELYGDAVDGNLKISLKKFISSSSIATSIIEAAVAEYITKPQARAALGRLKSVKDKLIKAEIESLLIEHGNRKLTTSGSPTANAAIKHLLSRYK